MSDRSLPSLHGVIVSHAAVAQALVSAVTVITGIDGALTPVSNEGCGTDALAERRVRVIGAFPADSHAPIAYPAAMVRGSKSPRARAFLDFLASAAARETWVRYGFAVDG